MPTRVHITNTIKDVREDQITLLKWLARLERRSQTSYWGLRKNCLIPHDRLVEMHNAHEAITLALNTLKESTSK